MNRVPPDRSAEIAALKRGEVIQFRPVGGSMRPHIEPGALITVDPTVKPDEHSIVFCRVSTNHYVHFVVAVHTKGFLIGNANAHRGYGRANGYADEIYGVVTKIEQPEPETTT